MFEPRYIQGSSALSTGDSKVTYSRYLGRLGHYLDILKHTAFLQTSGLKYLGKPGIHSKRH